MVILVLDFSGTALTVEAARIIFIVPLTVFKPLYGRTLGRGWRTLHTSGEDVCDSIKAVQGLDQISTYTLLNFFF